MKKTILVTGSTDGIGLETAKMLHAQGHFVLLHGRYSEKLEAVKKEIGTNTNTFKADLSDLNQVVELADKIKAKHGNIDVIINNAGVFKTSQKMTADGLDARYVVNVMAPYLLTRKLLPIIPRGGRVVNLSSAAQTPVNTEGFFGKECVNDGQAYAESKLALTMWTNTMAKKLKDNAQVFVSVNPASMLGSKMVKEAYGVNGADLSIGADILTRAALSDEFADASGKYYDNDIRAFSDPHPDALDSNKCNAVVEAMQKALDKWL